MSNLFRRTKVPTASKYTADHSGEKNPTFKNLTEVKNSLSITEYTLKTIEADIIVWFDKNPTLGEQNMGKLSQKAKLKPLIMHLDKKHGHLFQSTESQDFRIKCFHTIIMRRHTNIKRNMNRRLKNPKSGHFSGPESTPETQQFSESRQSSQPIFRGSTAAPEVDQDRRPCISSPMTPLSQARPEPAREIGEIRLVAKIHREQIPNVAIVSVQDLLPDETEARTKIRIIKRIRIETWFQMITDDLDLSTAFIATYESPYGEIKVKNDRNLQSAITQAHEDNKGVVNFTITPRDELPSWVKEKLCLMGTNC